VAFQVKILEVSFQASGHLYFRMKYTSSLQAVSMQILVFKLQKVSDVQSFLNRCRTINFSSINLLEEPVTELDDWLIGWLVGDLFIYSFNYFVTS
jgi:hypothetical protein